MDQPSYVENVPPEIWGEIFLHARKTLVIDLDKYDQTGFTLSDSPISVSQVCKRFRQIAINTPGLWSSIVVDLSAPNPASHWSLTRLWLERSKSAPLSLFMSHIYIHDIAKDPESRECLITLLSHIGQWREASIEWTGTDPDFWSSIGVTPYAPLLESLVLKVSVVGNEATKTGLLPSLIWANSPRLRTLEIRVFVETDTDEDSPTPYDHVKNCSWTTSYAIPYCQLNRLHVVGKCDDVISRRDILTIFQCAPNLVCCFIGGIGGTEPEIGRPLPPILMKHLRHLYLGAARISDDRYEVSVSQLLDYIVAPSLLSLSLCPEQEQKFCVNSFLNLIHRSSCLLEELNIDGNWTGVDKILACLKATSASLRKLHFCYQSKPLAPIDILVSSLTNWNQGTHEFELCPNLEQVSLFLDVFGFRLAELALTMIPHPFAWITKVMAARLHPPAGGSKRLKTLLIPSYYIRSGSSCAKHVPPELRMLCEAGLIIGSNDKTTSVEGQWERLAYQ